MYQVERGRGRRDGRESLTCHTVVGFVLNSIPGLAYEALGLLA